MELSVVIPVHNEASVLSELARRTRAAALSCAASAEVLLVDDASRDDTAACAATLSDDVVRFFHLTTQHGQIGATRVGLAAAKGDLTVVLDGDLQDPPETMAELVATLRARPDCDAVFAVKTSRDASLAGRAVFGAYHLAQRVFGDAATPTDAGSYCAFRAPVREALLREPSSNANLAVLLGRQRVRWDVVGYHKHERAVGDSRVGAVGLLREAVDSLAATGALSRMALTLGAMATLVTASQQHRRTHIVAATSIAASALVALAHAYERRFARAEAPP